MFLKTHRPPEVSSRCQSLLGEVLDTGFSARGRLYQKSRDSLMHLAWSVGERKEKKKETTCKMPGSVRGAWTDTSIPPGIVNFDRSNKCFCFLLDLSRDVARAVTEGVRTTDRQNWCVYHCVRTVVCLLISGSAWGLVRSVLHVMIWRRLTLSLNDGWNQVAFTSPCTISSTPQWKWPNEARTNHLTGELSCLSILSLGHFLLNPCNFVFFSPVVEVAHFFVFFFQPS